MQSERDARMLREARVLLWVCVLLGGVAGCDRDDAERCEELEGLIAQKQASVEGKCSRDTQCFVTELAPGRFQAVRRVDPDLEFDAAVGVYAQTCVDVTTVRRLNIFDAKCLPREDAPEYGSCQLTYEQTVVKPEEVQAVLAGYCECQDNSECGEGLLCGGSCLCETPCQAGCGRASLCSGWESLGIGTTKEACQETCSLNADEARTQALMVCLSGALTCVDVATCVAEDKN
jgi:hypothetical protein